MRLKFIRNTLDESIKSKLITDIHKRFNRSSKLCGACPYKKKTTFRNINM